MRKVHLLIGVALLLSAGAALVSCNNDDITNGNHANGDISFAIGFAPQTRVSTDADFKSTWEDGDAIGVYAVVHGNNLSTTASGNHIHNAKLTYSSGTWTQESPLYWPSGSNSTLDFYAYYPYDAGATDPASITFNVETDQSSETAGKSNYSLSDLLMVKSDNSGNGWVRGSTVGLTFSHALAMVQVNVPSLGKGFGPGEDLKVMLRGVTTDATLDLTGTSTTTGSNTDNIIMYRVEQPSDADYETTYTYRALVPSQSIAQGNSLFWFEHEKRQLFMDDALTQALTMTAGKAETFTRTLPTTLLHTVSIPAGTFLMGSSDGSNIGDGDGSGLNTSLAEPNREINETQHKVTLTKDFYMSKYQITVTQYTTFLNASGIGENRQYLFPDYGVQTLFKVNQYGWTPQWNSTESRWEGIKDTPMIEVNWYGALAYALWAGGTLPTEAQWEYACRVGTTTAYSFGDDESVLGDYAWYYDNSSTIQGPGPVGTKLPNTWGLYDMHGNVFEWCLDQWDGSNNYLLLSETDPLCTTGDRRVLRGGGWYFNAQSCRSAYRSRNYPNSAHYFFGFRVVFVP